MKRRMLLGVLGTASISVGAAFGSGAFTSIEADRAVELNVSNDGNAQIIFKKGSGVGAERLIDTDSSNTVNVIKFSQANLNEQSTTTFKNALEIINNSDDTDNTNVSSGEGLDIDFYVEDAGDNLIGDGDEDILDFRVENDGTSSHGSIVGKTNKFGLISPGDRNSVEIDIVVNLRADGQDSDDNDLEDISQVTFFVVADNTN